MVATSVASLLALSGCEDKDPLNGQLLPNGTPQSRNVDTERDRIFLEGMLEAVNSPRATTDSDAVQAFDNLYYHIAKNIK